MKPNQCMKLLIICGLYVISLSCSHSSTSREQDAKPSAPTSNILNFTTSSEEITADFMTWYNYTYREIRLGQGFTGLDTDSNTISKGSFLNSLQTGNFIAIKVAEKNRQPVYRLYPYSGPIESIRATVKQLAETESRNDNQAGKMMPPFQFTDLQGNLYNNASTKGKVLVLKCWFIHCVACVKEFPELNELVENYRDRKDLLFVSLATDPGKELEVFLKQRPFHYAVVPGAGTYMTEQLKVDSYPTHIIVGKDGKIAKVTGNATDMVKALEKVLAEG